jgi:hypothetical protein
MRLNLHIGFVTIAAQYPRGIRMKVFEKCMVRFLTFSVFAWALMCVGCPKEDDSVDAASCIEKYPGESEADFASDMWSVSCLVPYDEDAGDSEDPPACELTPPTIAEIEAECTDDGHDCAGQITVSKAAALCIGAADGLKDGLDGLHADLAYDDELHLPVWSVGNVLQDDGEGNSQGEFDVISAIDGKVLERNGWGSLT